MSLINHLYSSTCVGDRYDPENRDSTPDCGHSDCGILCDIAMTAWRLANEAQADFTAAHDATASGGDLGRGAIQRLLDGGMSIRQVASSLGVHVRIVTARLAHEDHTVVLAVEELLLAGELTVHAIAKQVGMSHQAVGRLAEAIHAPVVLAPSTEADLVERMRELHGQGWSVRRIATELGTSKSNVARQVSRTAEAVLTVSA